LTRDDLFRIFVESHLPYQDSGFSGRYIIYKVSIAFSIENLMGLGVKNIRAKKRYLLKGVGGKIRV
jgi:hypothetical protein